MKNLLHGILNIPHHLYMMDSFKNDEDFLIALILMGALFFLLALIIGVVLILMFFLILFFLISGGIISASVLVGIQQKSVSKGFKTLFLSVSILGTTIVSVIFFYFINLIQHWWTADISIVAGIICGALSGWLLGLLIFKASGKLVTFLKNKYNDRMKSKSIN
ncbi:hypothetical protein [Chryseobacterium shigense]|uniref:Uncharacterized protein n=1 Tax=Chryseobacterium shigense TaxID=297244 RepID=A0A841N7X8_9FLAO|nr:hypothetical protein [Chryseobacterium shigense]MBB6369618.1 hypothetical protein [Chryseobacterium shigense]